MRPYNIYKSASLRSAEYGRTSPDSTNRKMHKFDTTARRYGADPADPLGFGCRYSRRACTYLYHFSFSLYYSHPCTYLIHLLHPYNHLTAYLPIAFNLTPSVGRFYFRPYSTRSTRKYAAKRIKYFLNFFPFLKILREILSFRGRYGSIVSRGSKWSQNRTPLCSVAFGASPLGYC